MAATEPAPTWTQASQVLDGLTDDSGDRSRVAVYYESISIPEVISLFANPPMAVLVRTLDYASHAAILLRELSAVAATTVDTGLQLDRSQLPIDPASCHVVENKYASAQYRPGTYGHDGYIADGSYTPWLHRRYSVLEASLMCEALRNDIRQLGFDADCYRHSSGAICFSIAAPTYSDLRAIAEAPSDHLARYFGGLEHACDNLRAIGDSQLDPTMHLHHLRNAAEGLFSNFMLFHDTYHDVVGSTVDAIRSSHGVLASEMSERAILRNPYGPWLAKHSLLTTERKRFEVDQDFQLPDAARPIEVWKTIEAMTVDPPVGDDLAARVKHAAGAIALKETMFVVAKSLYARLGQLVRSIENDEARPLEQPLTRTIQELEAHTNGA